MESGMGRSDSGAEIAATTSALESSGERTEELYLNNELKNTSLDQWQTKISALPEQFRAALEEAMRMAVPDAHSYRLPKQTIVNATELDTYLEKVKQEIKALLDSGQSVILK